MTKPTITFSVLMPLFYKEKPSYFDVALASIYQQTLLPDEIVLVKEGVLGEELQEIIEKWEKVKAVQLPIRIIDADLEEIVGLPACLNIGIEHINTDYIARFDSDDENCIDRFEKQIHYLQNNKQVALLGGQIEEMDESMQQSLACRRVPLNNEDIRSFGKWRNPFNHQSVIYKTDIVKKVGGYPVVRANEDYALWGKFMAEGYEVANLPDVLVKARTGEGLYERRRGLKYLKGEVESLKHLHNSNFFNKREYYVQLTLRFLVRLLPHKAIRKVYRYLRD
jgi:glycosyltransferase involved in cell wall biosynthesis